MPAAAGHLPAPLSALGHAQLGPFAELDKTVILVLTADRHAGGERFEARLPLFLHRLAWITVTETRCA